jgi:hypothetical protein
MIIAVTMVRDEADIIEPVLRHLLAEGVDRIIVADNISRDQTWDILHKLRDETGRVVVQFDAEVGYYQADKMSGLARTAQEMGAEWVLPFDADEVWYGVAPLSGKPCRLASALAEVPEDVTVIQAPGWDHIGAGPFSPYRRPHTQQMVKVAFRAHPDARLHMGNHDVDRPQRKSMAGPLAFRHFQYRSLAQMTRKLRNGREAYEASDIHPMHGTHWRSGGLKSDAELAADWAELCSEEGLVFDPAPLRVCV